PFCKAGLAGSGQRVAPLEHRKGCGVAHDGGPDTEQTVGLGFRRSDITVGLHTADHTPRFPGCEVWVGGSERELEAIRHQHAACKEFWSVAQPWRTRDRQAITDMD